MSDGDAWRVTLTLPSVDCVPLFEAALEGLGGAVTSMELDADGAGGLGEWRLRGYGLALPDITELDSHLALAAAGAGIDPPVYELEKLEDTDWVAAAERERKPIDAGQFFVYPSHHDRALPAGKTTIAMDASMAFGSGEHATTRGCLIALDRLLEKRVLGRALDMGAGSAILAIALAKTSDAVILAADNDPVTVRIAAENATLNGVGDRIRCLHSQGFRNAAIRANGPYDLIFANILARPLIRMAPALVRHLAPQGVAILSGFLQSQVTGIEAAYNRRGARAIDRIDSGDWVTLVVERG